MKRVLSVILVLVCGANYLNAQTVLDQSGSTLLRNSSTTTGWTGTTSLTLGATAAQTSGFRISYEADSNPRVGRLTLNNNWGGVFGDFAISLRKGADVFERFRVTSNGNVGIGSVSPNAKLTVVAGTNSTSYLNGVSVYNSDGSVIRSSLTVTNGDVGRLLLYDSATNLKVHLIAKGDSYLNNTGNFGLGTSSPSHKLHVVGQGVAFYSNATDNNLRIGRNPAENFRLYVTDTNGYLDYVQDEDSNAPHVLFIRNLAAGTSTGNDIMLQTGGTTQITVKGDGNVGIGTTTPDAKLTVKGTIHTQEVKVDLNGSVAPDYVFADDYSLPELSQTHAFIKTNKHLPGIPSAAEMEEEGINLKEMNLKLLEKVEELTLHQIALLEKIEQLNKRVQTLEKN